MKIGPLVRPTRRPYAILIPGKRTLRVLDETGSHDYKGRRAIEQLLSKYAKHVLYAMHKLPEVRHTTGAISWQCHTWRGRPVRMEHIPSGASVTSLRGALDGSEDPYGDLSTVLGWLSDYGVTPGSIASMAWALWRAHLSETIHIGADPEVGRAAFYGGRQEAIRLEKHSDMVAYDIQAAYPVAMASRPYALSLREVSPASNLDPSRAGIAMAEVHVPEEMPWGPLPVRVAPGIVDYSRGQIRGIWPWVELAAAKELGCEVKISRMWAPRRQADLFAEWWPAAARGRALDGSAGMLAKAIVNSTWGQFGMVGTERGTLHWTSEDGDGCYAVPLENRTMPHEWTGHLAAETTSRIRARMLLEGLYGGCQPIYVDTDGMICSSSDVLPGPSGQEPGTWRQKATMEEVDIRGPQLYRWTCGASCGVEHDRYHYNAAGIPAEEAPAFFAARGGQVAVSWEHRITQDTGLVERTLYHRDEMVLGE